MPLAWSYFRCSPYAIITSWLFVTFIQVLTGELPFREHKQKELVYYVPRGTRPEKPANAKDLGISDPLWELIQKCWDGEITRRPQIQEVVKGVCVAAANWHTDMPPASDTEQWDDSLVYEESDEFKHSGFPLFLWGINYTQIPLPVGIFQSYSSEYPSPAISSAGASRPNDTSTVGTQQTLVETSDESYELVCRDLDQDIPPSLTAVPLKVLRGFRCYPKISAMLGRNFRH
jgi:hypothetical protein